jgi:hypothetical protein
MNMSFFRGVTTLASWRLLPLGGSRASLCSASLTVALTFLTSCVAGPHRTLLSPGAPKIGKDFDFEQIPGYAADVSAYLQSIEGTVPAAMAVGGGTACSTVPSKTNRASRLTFCTKEGKLVVQLQDETGAVTTATGNSITISSTPRTISEVTVTSTAGIARLDDIHLDAPGTYTLTATSASLSSTTSNLIAVAAVNIDRAKYFRNKIIDKFTGDVDHVYGQYINYLYAGRGLQSLESDFVNLGLTAASAITVVMRTKTILTSLALATAGVNLSVDKNFFGQQTFAALAIAMQARRDQARNAIIKNESLSVTDYSLEAARRDLVSYFYSGTLPGAIQEIQELATKKSEDAANKGTKEADNAAGKAAKLAFMQPSNGIVNSPLAVKVQVQDSGGKVVTDATNLISIAASPTEGVTGITPTNAEKGVATFNVTFSKTGPYTLVAIATGLTSGTSAPVTIVASGQTPPPVPAPIAPPPPTPGRITEGLH